MGRNRDRGIKNPLAMPQPGYEGSGEPDLPKDDGLVDKQEAAAPKYGDRIVGDDYRGVPADRLNDPSWTPHKYPRGQRPKSLARPGVARLDDDAPFGCD